MDHDYPLTALPNSNDYGDVFNAPFHDPVASLFDDDFNLSDFFNVDLDQLPWIQDGDPSQCDAGVEAAPSPPLAPMISEKDSSTPLEANSQPSSSPSHSQGPTPGAGELSPYKVKSNSLTEAEWEELFNEVFPLYMDKGLKDILKLLPEKTNLKPSYKQLKTRIKLWHEKARLPRKKVDKDDMNYMLHVAQYREEVQGLQTMFTYYGFPLSSEKLRKHKDRFGMSHCSANLQDPPSHISWTVPSTSATTDPVIPSSASETFGLQASQDKSYATTSRSPLIVPDAGLTPVPNPYNNISVLQLHQSTKVPTPNNVDVVISESALISIGIAPDKDRVTVAGNRQAKRKKGPDPIKGRRGASNHAAGPGQLNVPSSTTHHLLGSSYPQPNSPALAQSRRDIPTSVTTAIPNSPEILREPDTRKISIEQLTAETKSIYAGLTMVESKCIQVDRKFEQQAEAQSLSEEQWQALVALHRTLLHEHHDFFLATQHPCASPALRRLVLKYSMPARMWKHGIQSFIELLRKRLPDSLEHMVSFVYFAYQFFALMLETVPAFLDTWTECLGDLARYRFAIEDEDVQLRSIWAETSRHWYTQVADREPSQGRLYHHLGILARGSEIRQLFLYCRSLTSRKSFQPARETILHLEKVQPARDNTKDLLRSRFIKTHLALFHNNLSESLRWALEFMSSFKLYANSSPVQLGEESTHIAITNIAALFDYGNQTPLRYIFDVANHLSSSPVSSASEDEELPEALRDPVFADLSDVDCYIAKCDLLFNTLEIVLTLQTALTTSPHVLIVMTFLLSLMEVSQATSTRFSSAVFDSQLVFERVPWSSLCGYLNGSNFDGVRDNLPTAFPQSEDAQRRQLPEDYLVRGLVWTQNYFPSDWFDTPRDREEDSIESAINLAPRVERIAWLAHRLCCHGYLTFTDGIFVDTSSFSFISGQIASALVPWTQDDAEIQSPPIESEDSPNQALTAVTGTRTCSTSEDGSISSTSPSSIGATGMTLEDSDKAIAYGCDDDYL